MNAPLSSNTTITRPVTDHRPPVVKLRPLGGWVPLDLHELWAYRELLYFLAWRDLKVRYRQTVLGALWALIQPVFTMVVFSVFFGRVAQIPSDGVPYPLFSMAALVPWTFFANTMTQAANTVVIDANMIRKIYFPRLLMPAASIVAGMPDLLLALGVLFGLLAYYGWSLSANVILLPLLVLLTMITSLGTGLWLAALNVQFRDVRYAIPFLVQAWLFATPIAYPSSLIAEPWRTLYGLNPMAGVVEGFRWALLGAVAPPWAMIALSGLVAMAILLSGAFYFRRVEQTFADII
jgi:lipopolysaccharide transport system permease protein